VKRWLLPFLLLPVHASAQWVGGLNLWPTFPVGIGQQAHPSIAFGVRCLDQYCPPLHGPGQRGISAEPMFNSEATTYATAGHFMPQFVPGLYTVPQVYGLRVTIPYIDPGVTLTTLYGLRIYDINRGVNNYAIYTDDGPVSFGASLTIRQGTHTITGLAGSGNRPVCAGPTGTLVVC
jgi:hypothetical protein